MGSNISYCSTDISKLCSADASIEVLLSICKLTYRQQLYDSIEFTKLIREHRQLISSIEQSSDGLSSLWPELVEYLKKIRTNPDGLAHYRLFTCYNSYEEYEDFSKDSLEKNFTEDVYTGKFGKLLNDLKQFPVDIPDINYPSFPIKVDPSVKTLIISLLYRWSQCIGFYFQELMHIAFHVLKTSNNDLDNKIRYICLLTIQAKIFDDADNRRDPTACLVAICLIHGAMQCLEEELDDQFQSHKSHKSWLAIRTQLSQVIPGLLDTENFSKKTDKCVDLYTKIFDFLSELPEEP